MAKTGHNFDNCQTSVTRQAEPVSSAYSPA